MATFTSKFGLDDLVYITTESTYFKTPTIYKIYSVTFIGSNIGYYIERVDSVNGEIQMVDESKLTLVQE